VKGITTPSEAGLPPFDVLTNIESIATRLHPSNSPDLDRRQQALREIESSDHIFQQFLKNYATPRVKPHVHPEVQVLEWFHSANRLFAADDPFVACSRPSCLCCQLYFRYHDGYFVEPFSDRKICLSWRPHELDTERNYPMSEQQQKTLMNSMIHDIRKEALRRIDERSTLKEKHPEMVTGLGEDESLLPARKFSPQPRSCTTPIGTSRGLTSGCSGIEKVSTTLAPYSVSMMLPPKSNAGVANNSIARHSDPRKKSFGPMISGLDNFVHDSDEEGGVLL
jgi:hypothetical protein